MSIIVNINIINKININGSVRILYDIDFIISKLIINLNDLVRPQAGQGILSIFLNIHGMLNFI